MTGVPRLLRKYHNILRLYVSMHDLEGVQKPNPDNHLLSDLGCVVLI